MTRRSPSSTTSTEQVKRTFPKVIRDKVFGAVKSAGFGIENKGLIFWGNHATSVAKDDPTHGTHYSQISLGNAAVLTEDQIRRILDIVNETRTGEDVMKDTGIKERKK